MEDIVVDAFGAVVSWIPDRRSALASLVRDDDLLLISRGVNRNYCHPGPVRLKAERRSGIQETTAPKASTTFLGQLLYLHFVAVSIKKYQKEDIKEAQKYWREYNEK